MSPCLLVYLPTSVYNEIKEARVRIIYRDQEWELQGKWRVRDAVKEVGLVPHAVLAVRDGKLLTEDVMLAETDEVKLVAVISGG